MGETAASNAVLAKARAMYGKRLTEQNYNELLACTSVSEAAAYLKAHTAYSDVFEGVSMGSLHRRQLESIVHEKLTHQYATLCRYEKAIGDRFYEYFVVKSDVELLAHAVRRLNKTIVKDFPKVLPAFFYKHSDVASKSLENITSFSELMTAVEGTPYKALLEPFASRGEGGEPDFFGMELSLNKYLYSESERLIIKNYKGALRRELKAMLAFEVDTENIVSLYRLKRLTDMPQTLLHTMLMPGGALDEKALNKFIAAPDAESALKTLKGTEYEAFCKSGDSSVEQVAGRLKYEHCKKKVRFSTKPGVVMMSFVTLCENEVDNITHIIEGIRYNIPPDEIRRLLIGVGD